MKNEEFDIRLVAVREIPAGTRINRWELMRHNAAPVNISIHASFGTKGADRLILRLDARYTAVRQLVVRTLMTFAVELVFDIDRLDRLCDDSRDEIMLPRQLLRTVMNVGIGTLRGAIAVRTADTFLANYPLPLYDLRDLVSNMAEAPVAARGHLPEITIPAQ